MTMDDIISITIPAKDSHFRLLPCPECKGDNVAYIQVKANDGDLWHGKCFDCGYTGKGAAVRHDAQIFWNKDIREV